MKLFVQRPGGPRTGSGLPMKRFREKARENGGDAANGFARQIKQKISNLALKSLLANTKFNTVLKHRIVNVAEN